MSRNSPHHRELLAPSVKGNLRDGLSNAIGEAGAARPGPRSSDISSHFAAIYAIPDRGGSSDASNLDEVRQMETNAMLSPDRITDINLPGRRRHRLRRGAQGDRLYFGKLARPAGGRGHRPPPASVTPEDPHHLFRRWAGRRRRRPFKPCRPSPSTMRGRFCANPPASSMPPMSWACRDRAACTTCSSPHEAMSPGEWKARGGGLTLSYGFHPSQSRHSRW